VTWPRTDRAVDTTMLLPPITDKRPEQPDPDATALIPRVTDRPAEPASDTTALLPPIIAGRPINSSAVNEGFSDVTALLPAIKESSLLAPADPAAARIDTDGIDEDTRLIATWRHRRRHDTRSTLRKAMGATGEVLLTIGLIALLFAAYEVWGKSAMIDAAQNGLERQIQHDWGDPGQSSVVGSDNQPITAQEGQVIARLYIPRLGKHWVVVQGVRSRDIRYAPGHYPHSAMPGQVGNFAVAGHRTPAIWWNLDQLSPGDSVIVETSSTYYVYRVSSTEIVSPQAIQVVAPVPDHPGQKPTQRMFTFTTCNPKWDNYQRLVVHGLLIRVQPRSAGVPVEMNA
jgi:sortase A